MPNAIVVLSGGLDSCVAACIALRECERVKAISFDYGQRHAEMEIDAAQNISIELGIQHDIVPVSLGQGSSVLMHHDSDMPHLTYEELQDAEGPSPTYVPYRNGTFLSLAASGALDAGADLIYAGMHGEDAHNWAYPDCTPEFIGAMQNAIFIGTYYKVRLVCPFTYMTKAQIIAKGIELGAPLHMTRSCYEGEDPACGKCPTCIARLEAFSANGIQDPIFYSFDKYRGAGLNREAVEASLKLNRSLLENE